MSFIKFTEEEKVRANEVSLIDYLHSRGEKLKRVGSSYFVESLNGVSVCNNKWYDHYNKKGGVAVGFLKEFYGYSYVDAVVELLGKENLEAFRVGNSNNYSSSYQSNKSKYNTNEIQKRASSNETKQEVNKKFTLPNKARNNDKLIDYLCNKRFIDKDIINHFLQEGSIYQSEVKNNIIFVGFDEKGVGKFGCAKGTYVSEKGTFTQTLTGSDCDYCFQYKNKSEELCVFEAPIDMLSFMTLMKSECDKYNLLALDGVSEKPLLKFLKQNEHIKKIMLCLDNDIAGFEATEKFIDILKESEFKHIEVKVSLSYNKDWNEELKDFNGVEAKSSVKHPKIEAYQNKIDKLLFFYKDNYRATEEGISLKYSDFAKNYKERVFSKNEEMLDDIVTDIVVLLKKHSKHVGRNVSEENIFKAFSNLYRTYKDKGRIGSKITELNELMKDFNNYREKPILTDDEKKAYIKNMVAIGITCIKVNIKLEELEQQLEEKQDTNFNIAEESEQVMNFG